MSEHFALLCAYQDPSAALSQIRDLETNPNLYQQKLTLPILAPGGEKYLSIFDDVGKGVLKAQIRTMVLKKQINTSDPEWIDRNPAGWVQPPPSTNYQRHKSDTFLNKGDGHALLHLSRRHSAETTWLIVKILAVSTIALVVALCLLVPCRLQRSI